MWLYSMEEYFAYHKKPHAKYMTVAQYNAQFNTDFPVDEEYDNAFKEAYTQARKAAGPDEFIKHIGMDHVQMVSFFKDDVAEDSATRQRVVVTESSNNVKGGFMTKYRELDETGVPVGEEFTASKTESGKFKKVFKYESGEEMKEGDIVIRKYTDGRNERGRISKITKQEIRLIYDNGEGGRVIDSENSRASQQLTLIGRAETPGGEGSDLPSETPLQPETPGGGGGRGATSVRENSRRVPRTQRPEGGGGRRRLFPQPVGPSTPETPETPDEPEQYSLFGGNSRDWGRNARSSRTSPTLGTDPFWGSQTPQSGANEDYESLLRSYQDQGKRLEDVHAAFGRYENQMTHEIQRLEREKDRQIHVLQGQVTELEKNMAEQNNYIKQLEFQVRTPPALQSVEAEVARLTTDNSRLREQVANLQSQQGNTIPLSHNQNAQQIFGQILSEFHDPGTYTNVSEALQTAYRSIPADEKDAFLAYLRSDFNGVYDEYTRTATV